MFHPNFKAAMYCSRECYGEAQEERQAPTNLPTPEQIKAMCEEMREKDPRNLVGYKDYYEVNFNPTPTPGFDIL